MTLVDLAGAVGIAIISAFVFVLVVILVGAAVRVVGYFFDTR